jgi:hypothetical protein
MEEPLMKAPIKFLTAIFCATAIFMGFSPAMAAKQLDVIPLSNGYPSGAHHNLNIHGKDADTYNCTSTEGGKSVFIAEYGDSKIQYVTNKKSSVTELTVLDPCAEVFSANSSPAKVQIPYEAEGYYVLARIRAKPQNGSNAGDPSSIIMSPNLVVEACNDTDPENPEFPDYTECPNDPLLALGLIVGDNIYEATDVGFVRFDSSQTTKGKGWAKATDITSLFTYSGWVYDSSLDTSGDGVVDINDVPLSYDTITVDGVIDQAEFELWRAEQELLGLATEYINEWILNIADLVVTEQDLSNDGVKLLKVRFYPVATTEYLPPQ